MSDAPLALPIVIDGKEYVPRVSAPPPLSDEDRENINRLQEDLLSAQEVAAQVPELCEAVDDICEAATTILRLVRVPGNGTGDEPREVVDLRAALRFLEHAVRDATDIAANARFPDPDP